jgi:predicted 3-demethylubiquinone-9 3-methyltransferase (glyoxalase superfamily)
MSILTTFIMLSINSFPLKYTNTFDTMVECEKHKDYLENYFSELAENGQVITYTSECKDN